MYTHDNSGPRQTAQDHAVAPQLFHVVNGRPVHICGLCGAVVVLDHGNGVTAPVWCHA